MLTAGPTESLGAALRSLYANCARVSLTVCPEKLSVLLNAMFWTPGLVIDGAVGAAHLGGAALEAAGGAAEGVFEAILGFISSLFE